MTDYISRESFLERVDGIWDCADMVFEPNDHCCRADDCASCKWRETKNAIRKIAANIPAADVREVKRGRWTYKEGGELCADGFYCTACGTGFHVHVPYFAEFNFCPNCGAQMDMREES